jgi:MFS family permease
MEKDLIILILTKILRMFSYGAISVIFYNVLIYKGVEIKDVGILQSLISFGDIVISLYLTTRADKIGRRKTLIIGAMLKIFTGLCYALSDNFILLAISGVLGVISASGSEIGPFVPIEQAGIAQIVENRNLPSKSDI